MVVDEGVDTGRAPLVVRNTLPPPNKALVAEGLPSRKAPVVDKDIIPHHHTKPL